MVKKELFGAMSPLFFGLSKNSKENTSNFGRKIKSSTTVIEETDDDKDKERDNTLGYIIYIICAVIAVYYFALPCTRNGRIDIIQILLAIFFPFLFIIFRLIYPCTG